MLPSPTSSPSRLLNDATNTPTHKRRRSIQDLSDCDSSPTRTRCHQPVDDLPNLPTPPTTGTGRRRISYSLHAPSRPVIKKLKFNHIPDSDQEQEDSSSEEESDDDDAPKPIGGWRSTSYQRMMNACLLRPGNRLQRSQPSTRPILNTFVSSLKSDVYKCESVDDNMALTVPFSCSYSNKSRAGGPQLLAIASEEGSVHILGTQKRNPWDPEPPRTVYRPHHNAIFDLAWSQSDEFIVTASADQTARMTDVLSGETTHALHGHTSTLKTVVWDPHHRQLLATGGRDGTICIWDLRVNGVGSDDGEILHPVIAISAAHEDGAGKRKRSKTGPMTKSVTGLVYSPLEQNKLVSSGTFDGILKAWDIRLPKKRRKSTMTKPCKPKFHPTFLNTPIDPTSLGASRRSRGITSLTLNPVDNDTLYALSADSNIYVYSMSSLSAYQDAVDLPRVYTHPNMQTNSFYVKLTASPCGRWLASGGTGGKNSSLLDSSQFSSMSTTSTRTRTGCVFLFDVAGPYRQGVELQGCQAGDVNGIDWAGGENDTTLTACADDGTVQVWRPDQVQYEKCLEDPRDHEYSYSWVKA